MKKILITILILLLSGNVWAADTAVSGLTENTTLAEGDLLYTVDDPSGTPASRKTKVEDVLKTTNALTADATPSTDSLLLTIDDPAGTPVSRKSTIGQVLIDANIPNDLTITSTSLVTGAGLDASDSNITNVGQINVDSVDADDGSLLIGVGGDQTLILNSSDWGITATGVATNMGSITSDGTITAANANFLDGNIINVGNISLDSVSSDASGSIAVTLGTDAGDDLVVDTTTLVVEGDNNRVGIGTSAPTQTLEINGDIKISGDDLFMATNTDKAILVADGTNFNPVVSTGDVVISSDGSSAIQANSVALSTDTTGNYVASVTNGTYVTGGDGGGEGSALTLDVEVLKDLVTTSPLTGGTNDILPGADADITIGITVAKDIVSGDGLSGGENDVLTGADADLTLAIDLVTAGSDADSSTTQSDSGMEFVGNKLTLLRGCSDDQILKWDESQDDWNCEADTGGGGGGAYSDLTDPTADTTLAFAGYTNTWTTNETASDFFSITNSGNFGDVTLMKLEATGNPTNGTILEIVNTNSNVDSIVAPSFTVTQGGLTTISSTVVADGFEVGANEKYKSGAGSLYHDAIEWQMSDGLTIGGTGTSTFGGSLVVNGSNGSSIKFDTSKSANPCAGASYGAGTIYYSNDNIFCFCPDGVTGMQLSSPTSTCTYN